MSTTCTTPPDPANLPMTSTTNPIAIPLQTLSQSSTTSSATVSEQTKRDNSYRYEGYQAFSSWMASEDDFFLFRRFDSLNAQTILWMQDRITRIEGDLQGIHKCIENSSFADGLRNDSFRWDERYAQKRHQLMGELSQILFHCNQYIDSFSKIRARPRAEQRKINNVTQWLKRGSICDEERTFIDHPSDLITINHRVLTLLNRFLESISTLHVSRLFRVSLPAQTLPLHHSLSTTPSPPLPLHHSLSTTPSPPLPLTRSDLLVQHEIRELHQSSYY